MKTSIPSCLYVLYNNLFKLILLKWLWLIVFFYCAIFFYLIAHCFQQSFKQIISIKTTLKRAYLQNSRYTVHRNILYWCFWSHPQDWFEYQPYITSFSNTQYSIKTHIKTKIKTKTTKKIKTISAWIDKSYFPVIFHSSWLMGSQWVCSVWTLFLESHGTQQHMKGTACGSTDLTGIDHH